MKIYPVLQKNITDTEIYPVNDTQACCRRKFSPICCSSKPLEIITEISNYISK